MNELTRKDAGIYARSSRFSIENGTNTAGISGYEDQSYYKEAVIVELWDYVKELRRTIRDLKKELRK